MSIAANDVFSQGYEDVVVGSPDGVPPAVKTYYGVNLALVNDFTSLGSAFNNGVFVG